MAKGNKTRISERPIDFEKEPSVFMSIPVSKLPDDMKKRHLARRKKIDANQKENDKLFKEGEADIKKLIASIKASKDGK